MSKKFIKAVLPLLAFGLPHRENQFVELEEKQADEIIEAGYAEECDEATVKEVKAALAKAEKGDAEKGGNSTKISAENKALKAELEVEKSEKEALKTELEAVRVELTAENEALKAELEAIKLIPVTDAVIEGKKEETK